MLKQHENPDSGKKMNESSKLMFDIIWDFNNLQFNTSTIQDSQFSHDQLKFIQILLEEVESNKWFKFYHWSHCMAGWALIGIGLLIFITVVIPLLLIPTGVYILFKKQVYFEFVFRRLIESLRNIQARNIENGNKLGLRFKLFHTKDQQKIGARRVLNLKLRVMRTSDFPQLIESYKSNKGSQCYNGPSTNLEMKGELIIDGALSVDSSLEDRVTKNPQRMNPDSIIPNHLAAINIKRGNSNGSGTHYTSNTNSSPFQKALYSDSIVIPGLDNIHKNKKKIDYFDSILRESAHDIDEKFDFIAIE